MSFGLIAFTNRGKALQAKAQAGTQLNFTSIAVGDGQLSGQAIADLTALIHEVKSITLNKFKTLPGGKAVVGGVLSNQDLQTGFWWRELGLFAQDPDLGEILYCYGNAGELAEYIPSPGGAEILEKQVDIVSIIGNAQNVSASIEQSLIYATVQDVQVIETALNAHKAEKANLSVLGHVNHAVLTATLDTTWSGTSAPYTKTVSVSGILSTDTPIIDVVMSGTYSTDEARIEAWGYIYRAVTANGSITFYATEKPTVSLPIQIKVVR